MKHRLSSLDRPCVCIYNTHISSVMKQNNLQLFSIYNVQLKNKQKVNSLIKVKLLHIKVTYFKH